jgi:heptaprenylglyceryl phosphate synthase
MQLPDDKSLLARKSRKENAVSRLGETLFFGGGIQESRKASQAERLIAPRIFARGELAKTPDENSSCSPFPKQLQIF